MRLPPPPPDRSARADEARETRVLRDRQIALTAALDRQTSAAAPFTSAKMALSIFDGGAMPAAANHYFLGHPVSYTALECEGCADAGSIDTTTSVPVFVIGSTVPAVGDVLTAYGVGNRWVAERGTPAANCCMTTCAPCKIPKKNLILSYVNAISGDGATTLYYSPEPDAWTSECVNGLLFKLICNGGELELRVIYFTTGPCPTGTQQYCSNLRVTPYGLTLSAYVCSPFSTTFLSRSAGCPAITSSGYTQFVVADYSPIPPSELFCQTFTAGFAGVTFSVYASDGGALLATGITGSDGSVYLTWAGVTGPYYVTCLNTVGDTPTACTLNLGNCGTTTAVNVQTTICECVVPGTITVTVQAGTSAGAFVASATALANGHAAFLLCTTALYYFSASTTAGGYSVAPLTAHITAPGSGGLIYTPLVPTTLTASGFWGSVTLAPWLGDLFYFPAGGPGNLCSTGSNSSTYIGGPVSYTFPATNSCPAATVDVYFVFIFCGAFGALNPVLKSCYKCHFTGLTVCPGGDGDLCGGGPGPMGPVLDVPACYPLDLASLPGEPVATVTQ